MFESYLSALYFCLQLSNMYVEGKYKRKTKILKNCGIKRQLFRRLSTYVDTETFFLNLALFCLRFFNLQIVARGIK